MRMDRRKEGKRGMREQVRRVIREVDRPQPESIGKKMVAAARL